MNLCARGVLPMEQRTACSKRNLSIRRLLAITGDGVQFRILRDEICHQTPSFNSFQQERWFTHCDDAAVFFGPAGTKELQELDPAVAAAIREESGLVRDELDHYMTQLDKDHGPKAYVFRCRVCGAWGGYSDEP